MLCSDRIPIMATIITAWEDLAFFHEEVDGKTGEFRYSTFALVDEDDVAYFGKTNLSRHNVTFEQIASALVHIPDNILFPEWAPRRENLTLAQDTVIDVYIKRPNLPLYDFFREHNVLELIPKDLLEESREMGKWRCLLNTHTSTLSVIMAAESAVAALPVSFSTGTHTP
jgi:hypothetical protein